MVTRRGTRRPAFEKPILPEISFQSCPIRASLGVLGRKWALLVLRDIGFLKETRFRAILRNNTGMTPRILSMRLRDLQREDLIERVVAGKARSEVSYRLTAKGRDVLPVLTALIQYGARHYASRVFEDGRPRDLDELFPARQDVMLGRLTAYAEKK